MKKENILIALATGAGIGAAAYTLLSKDIPKGATAVEPFDIDRFMGKWNEIARLPIRIEKNMRNLTETYVMNGNGDIEVSTEGYNVKKEKWIKATGKMKPNGGEGTGMLKVSYFGPFYLAYNLLAIDPDYKYVLVSGSGLGTLWILSRESAIPEDIKEKFLSTATAIGFAVNKLEWVS